MFSASKSRIVSKTMYCDIYATALFAISYPSCAPISFRSMYLIAFPTPNSRYPKKAPYKSPIASEVLPLSREAKSAKASS
jgi:hypothetical protein